MQLHVQPLHCKGYFPLALYGHSTLDYAVLRCWTVLRHLRRLMSSCFHVYIILKLACTRKRKSNTCNDATSHVALTVHSQTVCIQDEPIFLELCHLIPLCSLMQSDESLDAEVNRCMMQTTELSSQGKADLITFLFLIARARQVNFQPVPPTM